MVMVPDIGTPGKVEHFEVVLVSHTPQFVSVTAHNQSCHESILKAMASALLCSLAFSAPPFFELPNLGPHMLETVF